MSLLVVARIALFAIGLALVGLALYGWLNRRFHVRGTLAYVGICVSAALYTGGYALELGQSTVDGFFAAACVGYAGLSFIPSLWVMLIFSFTGRSRYLSPLVVGLLVGASLLLLGLVLSNPLHGLYFRGIVPTGQAGLAQFLPGELYPIGPLAFYAAFVVGLFCLRRRPVQKRIYRFQQWSFIAASLIPVAGNLLYLMGFRPGGLDLNPFSITASIGLFGLGLYRNRLFGLVPIAREQVVESMADAVVVLDARLRILDFNLAARSVFPGLDDRSLGLRGDTDDSPCQDLTRALTGGTGDHGEFSRTEQGHTRWFQFHRSRIVDRVGNEIGHSLLVTDRTDYMNLLSRMTELATRDPLTGIYNRRRFAELAEAEIHRSIRYSQRFSIIMFDIDHFKHINDSWGHKVGDAVLQQVAERAQAAIRTNDVLARIGGEEFMVMLPATDAEGAAQNAERIRQALSAEPLAISTNVQISVSASFGISEMPLSHADLGWAEEPSVSLVLDELMIQADKAMYQAKDQGRNRVVCFGLS